MLRFSPLLLVTFLATPALAGATPWQDIAPGARARLISADNIKDGKLLAGLELDLPANAKTYWRIPGEAGIPTQFDFAGSVGLSNGTVLWPYPEIDKTQGLTDYAYHGHTVLPLQFSAAGDRAQLEASVVLGVCSDICVPAQAKFSLSIATNVPDAEQSLRLDQAVAATPIAWDQPNPAFGAVTATPDGLAIGSIDPSIDPQSLIADVGDPAVLFATPQKSPEGAAWTVKLLGGSGAPGLEGRTVQLTFQSRSGPYTVARQIAAP
jgi:DsbC/DsbD-like thiol-disulfide interchange protein